MADILAVSNPIVDWFKHSMVRTISVVVGATLLIALPVFLCYMLYHKGYEAKVCPPQAIYQAPCTQNYITNKPGYAVVGLSTSNYCFGICHK